MKERGILFSGPLVRALLAGTKTQTRRLVKAEPGYDHMTPPLDSCPYGPAGRRLWVRETWAETGAWACPQHDGDLPDRNFAKRVLGTCDCHDRKRISYRADRDIEGQTWRPSIFMPRWASRITLEVTSVRVERLQDVSEEDAKAEGVHISDAATAKQETVDVYGMTPYRAAFACLWEQINGERASWASNPWVWVVAFMRIEVPGG